MTKPPKSKRNNEKEMAEICCSDHKLAWHLSDAENSRRLDSQVATRNSEILSVITAYFSPESTAMTDER